MRPFDYLCAEKVTKYSEVRLLAKMAVSLSLPQDLVLAVVEEARNYYKTDGYHNFKHALISAAYCAEYHPESRGYWFAMLFHDTHWSKTLDRHNVFASMYRAAKTLFKFPELDINLDTVTRYISYTCFDGGRFHRPDDARFDRDYAIIHMADVYAANDYDIWPEQYRGLAGECGWSESYETLSNHYQFLNSDYNTMSSGFSTQHWADVIAYRARVRYAIVCTTLGIISKSIIDFRTKYGIEPNTVIIGKDNWARITRHPFTQSYLDAGISKFMGLDIYIVDKDVIKVGFI